jgi:hypothetical protein
LHRLLGHLILFLKNHHTVNIVASIFELGVEGLGSLLMVEMSSSLPDFVAMQTCPLIDGLSLQILSSVALTPNAPHHSEISEATSGKHTEENHPDATLNRWS